MYRKDWASAFQIAFKLNKPRALLNVVNQLFLSTEDDEGLSGISKAQETLRAILSKLQDEHLVKLFSFVCDWNTTSGESTKQTTYLNIFELNFVFSKFNRCSRSFAGNFFLQDG